MNPTKETPCVLVCDPDPQAQKLIGEYLQESSFKVFFSRSSEALETALTEQCPFSAVLIDLPNPVKNSCRNVVMAIKSVAPRAQIIFMSRLADDVLWSQVLAQGAYDLLPKPPDRKELLRAVTGALQQVA